VPALAVFLALAVVGSLGTGAVVAVIGQSALSSGTAQLTAAHGAVDAALAQGRTDGLTEGQLAAVRHDEERVLGEAVIPNTLWIIDAGQAAHMRSQSVALQALPARIDLVRKITTDRERRVAMAVVDEFDGAIAAADQAGLVVADDQDRAARARQTLIAARTPVAVSRATADLSGRGASLHFATAAKVAADAAAAELSSRRDQAQGALTRAGEQLTLASAFPQLQVAPFKAQLDAAQTAFAAATAPADFQAVAGKANDAGSALRAMIKARAGAYQALSSGRQVVQQATVAKIDVGTIPAQLDALGTQLDAAGTSDQFQSLGKQVDDLISPLSARLGIADLGAGKVIVISLDNQNLTAYEDGRVFLTSLVTTGRPALPTPTGTTAVTGKSHPWHMTSDWPQSSPFWYPPSDVNYVLWFRCCGYGMHDAPWRSTYGPGTQEHGSHGCVNVPAGKMEPLFNWADVGTRVIVR